MNDIEVVEEKNQEVYRPSAAIDPQRLEYLWTLAERMASSTLVPESLRTVGNKNNKKDLSRDEIVANVFAVVEQADRWNISPFALLSCAAIVHGKLGFEGKVIATVLESLFQIKLYPYFKGEPKSEQYHVYLCDKELPDEIIAQLKPGFRHDRFKIMDGSVAEWKTTGDGSPWRPNAYGKMLVYRGSREWSRVHKPAAIMGVLGDDELHAIDMEHRAQIARDVTPSLASRFGGGAKEGFSADNIKQIETNSTAPMERVDTSTGEIIETKTTESSRAAAFPAADDGSGAGTDKAVDAAPANSSGPTASKASDDKAVERETPPARSAAADHALSAAQLIQAAKFLARQDTEEKINKAAASIKAGSDSMPAPNDADLRLLAAFKAVVIKCINDGVSTADELDIFSSVVDGIFSGDVND